MKESLKIGAIAWALSLSGCSTIQNWFPDKEKDYQFTTELPPLVIPSDLMQKKSLPARTVSNTQAGSNNVNFEQTKPQVKPEPKEVTKNEQHPKISDVETEITKHEIQLSLTHETVPLLNLNVPVVRAWRIVGKALSRSNVEVTKHDVESSQIHIQVANEKTKSEKSLWDNTVDVFNPFTQSEEKYILQFKENNAKTSVIVLDEALNPVSDDKLLSSLFDLIKTDLSH